jgi:cholesterol oxidase
LEFLCAHGFDVWLIDLRVSIDLPASDQASNADDVATKDFPAAVSTIRFVTGATHVDALVHCYGATTLFMSMLAGLQGVRSIMCSQVATHAFCNWRMRTEAFAFLPSILGAFGVNAVTARPSEQQDALHRAYDAALSLWPMPAAERCTSATCRRISFLFGRLYQHDQLDAATHDALPSLFGVASLAAFDQLAAITRHRHIVTARGRDEYLPRLDRLGLPITFIHGALNQCYLPESTEATFDALTKAHGRALYERHVVPGYGHIDCIFGKNAVRDVYPLMLRHFDRVGS